MDEHIPEPERSYKRLCKSIRFLDEKFNDVVAGNRGQMSAIMQDLADLGDRMEDMDEFVSGVHEDQLARIKHDKYVTDHILDRPTDDKVLELLEGKLLPLKRDVENFTSHVDEFVRLSRELPGAMVEFQARIYQIENVVTEVKEVIHKEHLKMNVLHVRMDELERESHKHQRNIEERLNASDVVMNNGVEDLKICIVNVDNMGKDLKAKMGRDTAKMASGLADKFNELKSEYSQELQDHKQQRKDLLEEVGRIEHEMLKSLQSGKSGKEMEDFLKQVSYNAEQISRIHQLLEGNK